MRRPATSLLLCVVASVLVALGAAAHPAASQPLAAATQAHAKAPAHVAPTAPAPEAANPSHTSSPPVAERRGASERTLDAITIEGEIAVPQVLFITSRDQPRYRDLLHRYYLRTSLDVDERALLPSRVLIKEPRQ